MIITMIIPQTPPPVPAPNPPSSPNHLAASPPHPDAPTAVR